jgi:aldehyde:ferredoxin oxidoreductase
VNLQTQSCVVESVPEKLYRKYLGGYGLGSALLLGRMDPACEPLGPENILGFASGYLTGTGAYIASRFMVFGKSPSTDGWGDANCGGHFGPKMKKAGLDVMLFCGRAGSPVYLLVQPGGDGAVQGQILDAEDLWGKDCYRTEDCLIERHGKDCEVAYATECYERGLIGTKQTDGLELGWGKSEAIVALVEKIGRADGIGAVLARGFEEAVRVFGQDTAAYVMAVRGEALPAHDPRWNAGLALTYFMDPTPARHTQGSTAFPIAGYDMPEIKAAQAAGRAEHHSANANWAHVLNSAGLCLFGYAILSYKTLPHFLKAADGSEWTLEELADVGRRLTLARQIFNVRAGWTLDRYAFPERVLGNPPLPGGETGGVKVDLKTMVKEYLETEGLDPSTGLPSPEVLESLDLGRYLP